jgi:hypothetical protein
VRKKRPIKHEHGGTTVVTDGPEALRRAEQLARECPDGWVYVHLEYRGKKGQPFRRIASLKGEANYDPPKLGLEGAHAAVGAATLEARRRVRLNRERQLL